MLSCMQHHVMMPQSIMSPPTHASGFFTHEFADIILQGCKSSGWQKHGQSRVDCVPHNSPCSLILKQRQRLLTMSLTIYQDYSKRLFQNKGKDNPILKLTPKERQRQFTNANTNTKTKVKTVDCVPQGSPCGPV